MYTGKSLQSRVNLPSSARDTVGNTGTTDEDVRMDNDAALFTRVVHNEAPSVSVVVRIHLDDITRTDVQVEP